MQKKEFMKLYKESVMDSGEVLKELGLTRQGFYHHTSRGRIFPLVQLNKVSLYWRNDVESLKERIKENKKLT